MVESTKKAEDSEFEILRSVARFIFQIISE